MHYFASYEIRARAGHDLLQPVVAADADASAFRTRTGRSSFLVRVDDQLSTQQPAVGSRVALELGEPRSRSAAGGHPSAASDQTKDATNVLGTWSR